MNWVRIGALQPFKGSTLVVFTSSYSNLRYRVCGDDLLKTMSDATHWAYLTPPTDHYESREVSE